MNKSLVTSVLAAGVLLSGFFSPYYSHLLTTVGLFSFSGAITNWLAIHMLFNKIPFLYGSGVIPNRFADFKIEIRNLILGEFFKLEDINKFGEMSGSKTAETFVDNLDLDKVYQALVESIVKSPLGSAINLFGGPKILETLKEPIKSKIKEILIDIGKNEGRKIGSRNAEQLRNEIINIVEGRLEDLTPKKIKEIMEEIIQKHLGWLVVWGAAFGGLIGIMVGLSDSIY